MSDLSRRYEGNNRIAAARQLLTHPEFPFLALMLQEIEAGAVAGLREGIEVPKHVAVIQAVELLRVKIRLEATQTGLKEDPLGPD